jgi:hypothetical protein
MFTDSTATPTRVELLIDIARSMSSRKFDAQTVRELLQPTGLPGLSGKYQQTTDILSAARDLDLLVEDGDGQLKPTRQRDTRTARQVVLDAIDERVLQNESVEPWFALFYAYILGRNEVAKSGEGDRWEAEFNRDLFANQPVANRFNKTKYVGLRRWFRYSGLGWHDSADAFVPNPYERLARAVSRIFKEKKRLEADDFMNALSITCPELDGGWIFMKANPLHDAKARRCTIGLSHALIDLHMDGVIELNCPVDSDGWSIASASPPYDGKSIKSDRFTSISLLPAYKERTNG